MGKRKKYGNPMKEKECRKSLEKEKFSSIYDFIVAFLDRTEKNNTKILAGQDISQFDHSQLMIDLGIALSADGVKLEDITSHSKPFELTMAVAKDRDRYNIVSAIFNESEIVIWMPNIPRSEIDMAVEFIKLNRVQIVANRYRKYYPDFAA
jgi:hypothetical protein